MKPRPRVVALIPARGGSKGLPGKNLCLLAGKPLLLHTVDAAMQSALVTDIFVSSDDASILHVAREAGCNAIARPPEFATDASLAADVVRHFLGVVCQPDEEDPIIVYLQPTSPCRTTAHIDEALGMMLRAEALGVVSVTELEQSPYKSFRLDAQGRLRSLLGERLSNLGRQQLPRTFAANGAIYAFRRSAFVARQGFPSDGSVAYLMQPSDSIDIDDRHDLLRAEQVLGVRHAA